MKIIIFNSTLAGDEGIGESINFIGVQIEGVFRCLDELIDFLKYPSKADLFILAPGCGADLTRLVEIKDFFRQSKIIIILPDSLPETIKMGHLLRPRLLTFDFCFHREVPPVIEKMTAKKLEEKGTCK